MPEALLINAYAAHSHQAWARGVQHHLAAWRWRCLELPARFFSWRVRGSGLSLLDRRYDDAFAAPCDVLLATSMLDLATLRAGRPHLGAWRCVLYVHENQFAYPGRLEGRNDVELGTIKNLLAADRIAFNSAFNRDTCLDGARALLARMPDGVPADLVERIAARSVVLPVPLTAPPALASAGRTRGHVLRILWNHRWEHDKAPERLLLGLRRLAARGVSFELHLAGQRFRRAPAAFDDLAREFAASLATCGFVADADDYRALLARCDVVVSTALHDFQGLAVLEAVAAGCVPVVPDRLAYREFIPVTCRYASHPADAEAEAEALAGRLEHLARCHARGDLPAPPDVAQWTWPCLRDAYERLLGAARWP